MQALLFFVFLYFCYLLSVGVIIRRAASPGSRAVAFIVAMITPIFVPAAIVISFFRPTEPTPVPARLEQVEAEIAKRKLELLGLSAKPGIMIATAWKLRYEQYLSKTAGRIYESVSRLRSHDLVLF